MDKEIEIPEGYYLDDSVIYSEGEPIFKKELRPILIENVMDNL